MKDLKIGKVKINLEYYSGSDLYSDGEIENDLLEIVASTNNFNDVLLNDKRWPILYHLTPKRRNLLEWFNFNKDAMLLEIGAGCGALTGLFCENVQSVTAIELSKRRAEIIAHRYKDTSNLEVIVGNLNDIAFNTKFDYITLIGVLEYAGKYTTGTSPYKDFLSFIKKLLKPKGVLIMAIENKFGLKYWAGAREDHTGKYFDSIENYIEDSGVRTFGKEELETMLKSIGFKNIDFYYPMPDYKIPTQVFSDIHLPEIGQLDGFFPNFDHDRLCLFNEKLTFENLILNKKFDFFANSFLLFCENGE